jgi:hypothetical protein
MATRAARDIENAGAGREAEFLVKKVTLGHGDSRRHHLAQDIENGPIEEVSVPMRFRIHFVFPILAKSY